MVVVNFLRDNVQIKLEERKKKKNFCQLDGITIYTLLREVGSIKTNHKTPKKTIFAVVNHHTHNLNTEGQLFFNCY
jgi:hypothetical protein